MTPTDLQELIDVLKKNSVAEFKNGDLEIKFAIFGPSPHNLPRDEHGNVKPPADHSTLMEAIGESTQSSEDQLEEDLMWSAQ